MEDFYIKFKIISEQNDIKQLNLLYDSVDNIEKQLLMNYSAMFYNLNFIKYLVEEKGMNIHADNDYVFNISCIHNKPNITRYVISLTNGYDYINDALIQYAHKTKTEQDQTKEDNCRFGTYLDPETNARKCIKSLDHHRMSAGDLDQESKSHRGARPGARTAGGRGGGGGRGTRVRGRRGRDIWSVCGEPCCAGGGSRR